jgi:hypothetical protein
MRVNRGGKNSWNLASSRERSFHTKIREGESEKPLTAEIAE